MNQKMPGFLKAFFRRTFGSDFFAKALISQGESLLRPDRLAEWDAVLKRHRGSTQAVHAAGAAAEPAAAAHPSREPPIAIGHSGGDSAERRQQKEQLQLMRGELQARNVLEPLAQEVLDVATNNWWCHHGSRAGRGAQCEKCQLYNCLECQGYQGVCRNVGQCNQRSTGRGKGSQEKGHKGKKGGGKARGRGAAKGGPPLPGPAEAWRQYRQQQARNARRGGRSWPSTCRRGRSASRRASGR